MRTASGWYEADAFKRGGVDQMDTTGIHVRHVENAPVRRKLNVLRRSPRAELERQTDQLLGYDVDPDHLAGKLAAGNEKPSVRGKIHVVHAPAMNLHGVHELHRSRVAKLQPALLFRNDDRELAVRRVIHVVRIIDRNRIEVPASGRINARL